MESIAPFQALRRQQPLSGFVARVPRYFLVKSPLSRPQSGPIEYETTTLNSDDPAVELAALPAWAVAPLQKREGNPFPDRISIGRATNCDVVLRLSFVSKLHAHLLLEDGVPRAVSDNRSRNGTKVNGMPVKPGTAMPLHTQDRISFGDLDLVLMSSEELYDRLASLG
jgi:hypothetical protein